MRQGGPNNGRRPRGRHHGGGNGGPPSGNPVISVNRPRSAASMRHQTFDSNGPDVRVRGNAWQVYEKYQSLARDAAGAGDRVLAESYLQYAEHYYRIIEAINEATAAEQRVRGVQPFDQQPSVPPNYYGPDGTPTAAVPTPQTMEGSDQPAMPPAEVEMRNQPAAAKAPSPFFPPEEADQGSVQEPLVVNR